MEGEPGRAAPKPYDAPPDRSGGQANRRETGERESAANHREQKADEREHTADEREHTADEREHTADEREARVAGRERKVSEREGQLDERARGLGTDAEGRRRRTYEALESSRALLAATGAGAGGDRQVGGTKPARSGTPAT
jgi:uncharacterized protein (DUF3084 family)